MSHIRTVKAHGLSVGVKPWDQSEYHPAPSPYGVNVRLYAISSHLRSCHLCQAELISPSSYSINVLAANIGYVLFSLASVLLFDSLSRTFL